MPKVTQTEKTSYKKGEKDGKWAKKMSTEEAATLEKDGDLDEDAGELWHASSDKKSETADDDWAYIDDGFDEEIENFVTAGGKKTDKLSDISEALSTWRVALNNNYVLDDLLEQSQDVPSATAYGDLMRLIDDFESDAENDRAWAVSHKEMKASLKHLKGAATRLNESMMKTCAECYSDIDESTTYRDLTEIAADPVGYKLKKAIKKQNKRIFDRLNSYDDEIRGEKDMSRVVAVFLPAGQGDKQTTEEKARCDQFIDDYASHDAQRRKPHLERITNEMLDISISLEMFTQDYMRDNVDKVAMMLTQLAYFEDVRNDPVNAEYFKKLPEQKQKKLDIIDRIGTSFTPFDFMKNVDKTLKRPDTYRLNGRDEIRLEKIMQRGSPDDVVSDYLYDTKTKINSLKTERL